MAKAPKLPPCPVCKTKKYRKNATGNYVCKYGHQLANYHEEAAEEGNVGGNMRAISKNKGGPKMVKEKRRLYGPRATFLYYQMFQQCLRKMVQVLIKKFAAPPDLENAVRQIWLLYVAHSEIHFDYRRAAKSSQDASQSNEPEEDELEEDYEHNMSTAAAEAIAEENADLLDEGQTVTMFKTMSRWPNITYRHLLVFIYMGCVWLRWPILLSDLHRWSVVGKLPYVALTKDLPADFLEVISGYKLRDVKMIPSMPNLYYYTRWYFYAFRLRCNLKFPSSNYAPLVYRATRELMLPVESYSLAMYLMDEMENMHEVYPVDAYDARSARYLFSLCSIDIKIMAVAVFITKLFYKLDDAKTWEQPTGDDLYIPSKDNWLTAFRASKYRWESNLLNGGKKLPGEDEPDEENLRDMADMYKQTTHPNVSRQQKRDNILLKLLKNYVEELREKERINRVGAVGPVTRTKSSTGWEEGSTFTMIRDPYVRASMSDMEPLYRDISQAHSASDSGDQDDNRHEHRESFDEKYILKTGIARHFASQHLFSDIHSSEYDLVVDFASKLVGLTKADMIRVELSIESYLISKAQSQQHVLKAPKAKGPPGSMECFNCNVTKTSLWRYTSDGAHILCNACGLYYKEYESHRPLHIRQKPITVPSHNPLDTT
ncbi:hypothetical protein INT43_001165 [Umbelopsis isabellina]|uniref:GATA-type domain-containing protein n=1 Tax=Mortierella isabellina TaxID=91625 RepID=A0A8H7PK78_MORIS|nr:hypothetical protein INT43_001165 [Umbelopsis isabellina]